jgi:hypothetical protein
MNIPNNSFITLVEYTDPDVARVTWTEIDTGEVQIVQYADEADKERIAETVKAQMDVVRDTPAEDRSAALRKLAESR